MAIKYDQRQNHFLDADLVLGTESLDEVSRRIHMGAPLSNMGVLVYQEAVAV